MPSEIAFVVLALTMQPRAAPPTQFKLTTIPYPTDRL
jgi:hypothetical protein